MFVVAGDESKTRVDMVELKGNTYSSFSRANHVFISYCYILRTVFIKKKEHPFFIGTQFRPEYASQPLHPAPLFLGLILASAGS